MTTLTPGATGTYLDFVLETEWTAGDLINADFASATTQTGAIAGLDLDFTNLTTDGTNALYGIHLNDQVGSTASTEYGLYVEGTNWDYGIYSADNVGLAASSYLNWGTTAGTSGYGLRDNSGAIEYKDSGGSWTALNSLTNYWTKISGVLSPATAGDVLAATSSAPTVATFTSGAADVAALRAGGSAANTYLTVDNAGDLNLAYAEYISNSTDDLLAFVGSGGSDNTDLYFDLDGTYPTLYSNTDSTGPVHLMTSTILTRRSPLPDPDGRAAFKAVVVTEHHLALRTVFCLPVSSLPKKGGMGPVL